MPTIEYLVPDPQVCKEFHVTSMTIWRWDRDPRMAELGWPPKVPIKGRNYRHRSKLEAFKVNLLQRAVAERKHGDEAA